MAETLSTVTCVERKYLLQKKKSTEASVAHRLSWAARQQNTVPEDMEYCLLGIFDISIPVVSPHLHKIMQLTPANLVRVWNGPTARVQKRLSSDFKKKILRSVHDESILAWVSTSTTRHPWQRSSQLSGGFLYSKPIRPTDTKQVASRSPYITNNCIYLYAPLYVQGRELFGILNCGPSHSPKDVVALPIVPPKGPVEKNASWLLFVRVPVNRRVGWPR